jgi:chromosome segregation ATPase
MAELEGDARAARDKAAHLEEQVKLTAEANVSAMAELEEALVRERSDWERQRSELERRLGDQRAEAARTQEINDAAAARVRELERSLGERDAREVKAVAELEAALVERNEELQRMGQKVAQLEAELSGRHVGAESEGAALRARLAEMERVRDEATARADSLVQVSGHVGKLCVMIRSVKSFVFLCAGG